MLKTKKKSVLFFELNDEYGVVSGYPYLLTLNKSNHNSDLKINAYPFSFF